MIKEKKNITVYLACILFCLVLITTHMVGGLYSRYTVDGTGSDSARVITFGNLTMTESGDFIKDGHGNITNTIMVIPGVDIAKQATVKFEGSESAVYLFIAVTVDGGWTTADNKNFLLDGGVMAWSVSDDWDYVMKSEKGGTVTYAYYMALDSNTSVEKNVINGGKITVSAAITESQLENIIVPDITFQATAVQSTGFAGPQEAWDSIKNK